MEGSEQSESSDKSRAWAIVLFGIFRCNSDFDGNSFAGPYLYELEVEHPLALLQSLTMKASTTQNGEAKASIILVVSHDISQVHSLSNS